MKQALEHGRIETPFGEKASENQTVGRRRPVNQAWSKTREEKVKAVSERSKRNENQPITAKHETKRIREIAKIVESTLKSNSVGNRVNKIAENNSVSKMQRANTPDSATLFTSLQPEKKRQLIPDT